jgi:hypothetical protein
MSKLQLDEKEIIDHKFPDTWVWSAHIDCESNNYKKSIILQKTINTYRDLIENIKGFDPIHKSFGKIVKDTKSRMKSYSVFRKGIIPAWEDENNSSEFRFSLPAKCGSAYWSIMILEMIQDDRFKTYTNGARILLDRRGNYRMEIWMTSMDPKEKESIEKSMSTRLSEIKFYLLMKMNDNNNDKKYDDAINELNKLRSVLVKHIPKNKLYYVNKK